MTGELQSVFMVKNEDAGRELSVTHTPKYIGAIVKLLQWHQQGSVNLVYDMIKVEHWQYPLGKIRDFL